MAQDFVYVGLALATLQKAGRERVAKVVQVKVYNLCFLAYLSPER